MHDESKTLASRGGLRLRWSRKTGCPMLTCSKFFAILIFSSGLTGSAPAQDAKAQPADAGNNQKAHALLEAASKANGLAGDDVKPWHLKGTYTVVDGKKPETASIEEWSAARHRWRISYVGKILTSTVWSVSRAHELKAKKDQLIDWEPVTDPISAAAMIKPDYELDLMHLNLSVPLDCVSVVHPERYKKPIDQEFFPVLCFDDKLRLRLLSRGKFVREYDNYQNFQNHAVAGYVSGTYAGQLRWEYKRTTLEALSPGAEVLLTPGKDAVPTPYWRDSEDPQPVPVHREAGPTYFLADGMSRTDKIWVPVVIQKDGSVRAQRNEVYVDRGTDSAWPSGKYGVDIIGGGGIGPIVDATERWRFEPYIVDGEAVEVSIGIPFTEDGQPWGQW